MKMKEKIAHEYLVVFSMAIVIIVSLIILPLFADYQICKAYYTKVSTLTCMLSTKTKLTGDKE